MSFHSPLTFRRRIWISIAFVLAASAVVWQISGVNSSTGPSFSEFLNRARSLAGPGATDCGYVPLDSTDTKPARCASNAIDRKQPFFVVHRLQGTDSSIWTAVVQNAHAQAFEVWFDDDATGGNGSPMHELTVSPCAKVELDGGLVFCNRY